MSEWSQRGAVPVGRGFPVFFWAFMRTVVPEWQWRQVTGVQPVSRESHTKLKE